MVASTKSTKRRVLLIGLLVAAVLAGAAAGIVVFSKSTNKPAVVTSPSPTPSVTPSPTPSTAAAKQPAAASAQTGTIGGSLIYPAEGIPADLRVCAINLSSSVQTCTSQQLTGSQYSSGKGYAVTVTAGTYQVFAVAPSFDPNYRGYYSQFVTCGMSVECNDHAPINVTVTAGQTVDHIDVGDFYRT